MRQSFLGNLQFYLRDAKSGDSKYVLAILPVEVVEPVLLNPVRRGLAGQFPVTSFQFG
jgi:hypothetical protein